MQHRAETSLAAHCRARRGEQGTSVLEFALVLPVLLAMIFGIVELGCIYFANATVTKAAQVAVRYAVTGGGNEDGTRLTTIIAEAQRVADVLPGSVTVKVSSWETYTAASGSGSEGDAGAPCELVEVEVRYHYDALTPIVGKLIPDDMVLTGRERMINEPWLPCK
ncbi:MAG: pilus assembly protein [Proteobacteria bacterium]|nr:pilus assembly protein [Pseudomonadota bacterium]